jgi:hypothetical protein
VVPVQYPLKRHYICLLVPRMHEALPRTCESVFGTVLDPEQHQERKGDILLFCCRHTPRSATIPSMPRTARASQGGYCYHVLNRGNGRRHVFHKDGDYAAFVKALARGERAYADSPARLLPDARPFSFGRLADQRRRLKRLHAMADDRARAALSVSPFHLLNIWPERVQTLSYCSLGVT